METALLIVFGVALLGFVVWVVSVQLAGREAVIRASRPPARKPGSEKLLFERPQRRTRRALPGYEVPMPLDNGEDAHDEQWLPPPFEFDGRNRQHEEP